MGPEELKRRTKQFALRCMELADSLPNTPSGRCIGGQLTRCGSSVGSNYRAACRARSKPEFIARLGIVEEEADESGYWMELIIESGMKPAKLVWPLHQEADELVRIMVSSINSARGGARQIRNPQSPIRNG